jgi:hypothetical protein
MSKDKIDFLNKELKKIEDRNKKINDNLSNFLILYIFLSLKRLIKK